MAEREVEADIQPIRIEQAHVNDNILKYALKGGLVAIKFERVSSSGKTSTWGRIKFNSKKPQI